MQQLYIGFWLPAYFVIGVLAYLLDARWGVPTRRYLINLVSKETAAVTQGFVIERHWRVVMAWSLAISFALSVVVTLTEDVVWYLEATLALPEAGACFAGMHALPGLRWLVAWWRGRTPSIRSLTSSEGEAVQSTGEDPEEVRRSKIAAMDEILGRGGRGHG